MKKIVLASASPRRRELLVRLRLEFEVDPSDSAEEPKPGLEPRELVVALSQEKAKKVVARHHNAIIIAADTIGVFRGKVLGKPGSEAAAKQMLRTLSGRSHRVITGFTIMDTDSGRTFSSSAETTVWLKNLTEEEIETYVRTGEPLDKAGAYAIQGLGAVIVDRIEGDYYNVIGLPLAALAESLKEFGIRVL